MQAARGLCCLLQGSIVRQVTTPHNCGVQPLDASPGLGSPSVKRTSLTHTAYKTRKVTVEGTLGVR